MSGPAHGAALLAAVMATNLPAVDDDQRAAHAPDPRRRRGGIEIPRIALRHRLQRDVHGLDRSWHRMRGVDGKLVVELDAHGARFRRCSARCSARRGCACPVVRSGSTRSGAVVEGRWSGLAPDVEVRFVAARHVGDPRPPLAAPVEWIPGGPPDEEGWQGVAADHRWAMEVLGLRSGMDVEREDVNRRFRRLLRDAHPDSGGARARPRRGSPSSPRPGRSSSILLRRRSRPRASFAP